MAVPVIADTNTNTNTNTITNNVYTCHGVNLRLLLLPVWQEGEGRQHEVGQEVDNDVHDKTGEVARLVDPSPHLGQIASQE